MLEVFSNGGPVMIPLSLASVVALAIIVERAWNLRAPKILPPEEVERLRYSATNSLLTRRDVIVVSSVSCIYGLGTPEEYIQGMIQLAKGDRVDRDTLLRAAREL